MRLKREIDGKSQDFSFLAKKFKMSFRWNGWDGLAFGFYKDVVPTELGARFQIGRTNRSIMTASL